jgi:hypothetical protein
VLQRLNLSIQPQHPSQDAQLLTPFDDAVLLLLRPLSIGNADQILFQGF